jgi:hypothetical protein
MTSAFLSIPAIPLSPSFFRYGGDLSYPKPDIADASNAR